MKFLVSTEDARLRGIYKITNTFNGHYYIGSSTVCFLNRYRKHVRELKRELSHPRPHHNRRMWYEYRKYQEYFKFEIIDIISEESEIHGKEIEYLEAAVGLDPLCLNVYARSAERIYTGTVRDRISENSKRMWATPGFREKIKISKAHVDYNPPGKGGLISKALKGRKHSAEHRVNQLKSIEYQMKPVICRTTGKTYRGLNECARDMKLSNSNIQKCCEGMYEQELGHKFSYLRDVDMGNFTVEPMVTKKDGRGKIVLNLETGIYYDSASKAAKSHGIPAPTMVNRLNGYVNNKSPFRYV